MRDRNLEDGRRRVVIESVTPQIDGGRFAIKRVAGDQITVEADVFADGHDELSVRLLWRRDHGGQWAEEAMVPVGNDRWRGLFSVDEVGLYHYAVEAWIDPFSTWTRDLRRRRDAGQDVAVELLIGAPLVEAAAARAGSSPDADRLSTAARDLRGDAVPVSQPSRADLPVELAELMGRFPDRRLSTRSVPTLSVRVDRKRALFSAWYELFPRSTSPVPGRHGTFRDVIDRLPYVASLGFDVLYLPPIHPIGMAFRKGPNNALDAGPGDPGVPWAIGSGEGGHTSIHPELGTLADFQALGSACREHGMELALDIAFQASPDHPWAEEHPAWFRRRPDGTTQYAENPPKKYQDIYPFDFESDDWLPLWKALLGVMEHWAEAGVRIFRVDNPHTKPFAFWEWAIGALKARYPDLILLSEAFTRPRLMYRLAKLGFSQSYTYFTWRTGKQELTDYLTELTATEVSEYFRPNLWPNTPDILHESLQRGGRAVFEARVVLAATLSASYGIYGPAYEQMEAVAREEGSEEYLDSEKYEIRAWDPGAESIAPLVARLNEIRRAHPCLQSNDNLRFHEVDNEELMCYSKHTADRTDVIITVVNLDFGGAREGTVAVGLHDLGIDPERDYEVRDLLTGVSYAWHGSHNRVELVPGRAQAHVFAVRQ